MSRNTPEPELTDFERSLAALAPSPARFDRDRLMYEAGRRSVLNQPRRRLWPALAASLAAVAAGQAIALSRPPAPKIVERVVMVREPTAEPERPDKPAPVVILSRRAEPEVRRPLSLGEPADFTYLQLNRRVERFGLDGLPEPLPSPLAGADIASAPPVESPPMLHHRLIDELANFGGPL